MKIFIQQVTSDSETFGILSHNITHPFIGNWHTAVTTSKSKLSLLQCVSTSTQNSFIATLTTRLLVLRMPRPTPHHRHRHRRFPMPRSASISRGLRSVDNTIAVDRALPHWNCAMVNISFLAAVLYRFLSSGFFPEALKTALITPLLKTRCRSCRCAFVSRAQPRFSKAPSLAQF